MGTYNYDALRRLDDINDFRQRADSAPDDDYMSGGQAWGSNKGIFRKRLGIGNLADSSAPRMFDTPRTALPRLERPDHWAEFDQAASPASADINELSETAMDRIYHEAWAASEGDTDYDDDDEYGGPAGTTYETPADPMLVVRAPFTVDHGKTFRGIAEDGALRDQRHTGESSANYDPSRRSWANQELFGRDEEVVYGYVDHRGPSRDDDRPNQSDELQYYGDARFVMRPDVERRTTITAGDSLNELAGGAHPAPSPFRSGAATTWSSSSETASSWGPGGVDYIEAQVHPPTGSSGWGGVDLGRDVERVELPVVDNNMAGSWPTAGTMKDAEVFANAAQSQITDNGWGVPAVEVGRHAEYRQPAFDFAGQEPTRPSMHRIKQIQPLHQPSTHQFETWGRAPRRS